MKMFLSGFVLFVFLVLPVRGQEQSNEEEDADFDPEGYYADFYEAVVNAIVDRGMKNESGFGDEKRVELVAFIYEERSVAEFAAQFAAQYYEFLDRVKASGHFEGKEVERAIDATDNVAMPLAVMHCSGCVDIYSRKVLHPDFTAPIFENADGWDEETIISWIVGEVNEEELVSLDFGSFEVGSEDVIYHFRSPPVTWNIMTGREGYAVVRDRKLIKHVITVMN